MSALENLYRAVIPVDRKLLPAAQARLDTLTKPQGSLGRLEELAARLFCIQEGKMPLRVAPGIMFTVAGDHGVAAEGVSPYPQIVTRQMVENFLQGGAAINVLCRTAGMDLCIVDAGCAGGPFPAHPLLRDARCGDGTANLRIQAAMTETQCQTALLRGAALAEEAAEKGFACLGIGEMGIANTTAATALYCALLGLAPEAATGPGAGANEEMIRRKENIIREALSLHQAILTDPLRTLAALGGFEIAVMAGLALGAARRRMPILVDGFISTAAFTAACFLCPAVRGYGILTHCSAEPGYTAAVQTLGVPAPLLHLDMRLGEGTGAALGFSLLRSAAAIFNDMASFADAGISGRCE